MCDDKEVKGILKKSSKPQHEPHHLRWDEAKLQEIAENKDYGTMKIDEPKTPFHAPGQGDVDDIPDFSLDDTENVSVVIETKMPVAESDEWSEGESDKKHASFEEKRKKHYNEYQAVQMARAKMAEEDDDDDNNNE